MKINHASPAVNNGKAIIIKTFDHYNVVVYSLFLLSRFVCNLLDVIFDIDSNDGLLGNPIDILL